MNDERAAEGVEHLQAAARELLAAARSFLDVVEDVVEDRGRLADAAAVVTEVVRDGLGRRGAPWTAAWGGDEPADGRPEDPPARTTGDRGGPGDVPEGGPQGGAGAAGPSGATHGVEGSPVGQEPAPDGDDGATPGAGPRSRVRRIPVD